MSQQQMQRHVHDLQMSLGDKACTSHGHVLPIERSSCHRVAFAFTLSDRIHCMQRPLSNPCCHVYHYSRTLCADLLDQFVYILPWVDAAVDIVELSAVIQCQAIYDLQLSFDALRCSHVWFQIQSTCTPTLIAHVRLNPATAQTLKPKPLRRRRCVFEPIKMSKDS